MDMTEKVQGMVNNKRLKKTVAGSTIIEVIISVFLLTFGVLALMAAQIRSVAAIKEAENRTLIAQAAEALVEGMQINPTISNDGKITYARYNTKSTNQSTEFELLNNNNTVNTAAALAKLQLDNFQAALNQIPDVAFIDYVVCQDSNNPKEATITGSSISGNCQGNDTTVIKVVWQMESKNNDDSTIDYSYLLKVRG